MLINRKVVAFTGVMGSGKSEAVSFLKKEIGEHNIVVCKFAEPLYDIQEMIYARISSAHKRSADFVKDRALLQFLGTEWGRKLIKDSLWIDLWKDKVGTIINHFPEKLIVCDDLRFDNEAEAINHFSGLIVKIDSFRSSERIDISGAKHQSELGISPDFIDVVIKNNGSLEEYKNSLKISLLGDTV